MNLDPRAVALQGLGFNPKFVALQGLVLQDEQTPTAPRRSRPIKVRKPHKDDDVLLFIL